MQSNLNLSYITKLLEHEKPQSGLYIVPTPIGNLSDITIRSLKILSSVDLIMSEDTRVTKKLTSKYGIKSKIQSFHKFNSRVSSILSIDSSSPLRQDRTTKGSLYKAQIKQYLEKNRKGSPLVKSVYEWNFDD